MKYIFFLIIPFFLSFFITAFVRKLALKYNIMDVPCTRSSHVIPTPRGGGLGIYFAFVIMLFFLRNYVSDKILWSLFLGVTLTSGIGLFDDIKKLSIKIRFPFQIIAAAIPIIFGIRLDEIAFPMLGTIHLGQFSIPFTLLWILWMTNLYNFMDGIDGIAAGEATVVSIFILLLSILVGNDFLMLIGLVIIGSSIGFLIHNFPPAKIFMGDVASSALGYTFAVLAVFSSQNIKPHIPFLIFILLLGTFIFDTSVTLFKRILKRERWFEAHRSHYYQRLVMLGYSHLRVTMLECSVSCILGIGGIIYLISGEAIQLGVFISLLSLLTLSVLYIKQLETKKRNMK